MQELEKTTLMAFLGSCASYVSNVFKLRSVCDLETIHVIKMYAGATNNTMEEVAT